MAMPKPMDEEVMEPPAMADEAGEPDTDGDAEQGPDELSDDDLLALVAAERQASIGLDNDTELTADRITSLDYYKGVMTDVPSLEGRSSAVSTDIADAIETILPDIVEIFIGGDDVATFTPHGAEDEKAAQQETDYVNHVVLQQNAGFMTFYSAFKDALQVKVGIFKYWREESTKTDEMSVLGQTVAQLHLAEMDGWKAVHVAPSAYQAAPAPQLMGSTAMTPPEMLYDAHLVKMTPTAKVKIMAVPPENFSVAKDTVCLAETTYCAMRTRQRAQELIAQGYDPALVEELPECPDQDTTGQDEARDTAGESNAIVGGESAPMRRVEVIEHYIRVLEGDRLCLYCVVTGNDENTLLSRKEVERIPFAAITPYPVTHRFFGRSVSDLLLEVQRIRTVLTRLMLDSGYFALNQRLEVAEDQLTDSTIDDILDNRPNRPVVTKNGTGLKPIMGAGLSFDAFAALEYTATLAEQRTGIVRNAQGLNPDTLHDTAKGAMAMLGAAQKRVRMIARIFSETGIKDLFLGVHDLLRTGPAQPDMVRLRGKWETVDPTTWGIRDDMDIQIGVGSGGQAHDVASMQQVMSLQKELASAGPAVGSMVTPQNIYAAAKRAIERLGVQGAEQFITEPKPPGPPPPPPPDPKLIEIQKKMEIEQFKAKSAVDLERYKAEMEHQRQQEQMNAEIQLRREQMQMKARMDGFAAMADLQPPAAGHPVMLGGEAG